MPASSFPEIHVVPTDVFTALLGIYFFVLIRLFLFLDSLRAKESSESTGASSISLDNESVKISRLFSDHITLDRPFFSFFPLFFIFSLFLFVLLKVSPQSFSDNFPVIQTTFQSNSKRFSQIVNVAVK